MNSEMTPRILRTQSCATQARQAVREFHAAVAQPDLALVLFFCSNAYDREELADEMHRVFAGTQVVGCTTAGEIGPAGCLEHSLTGASFPASSFNAVGGLIGDLQEFKEATGQAFARDLLQDLQGQAPQAEADNSFGLLLVDGLSLRDEPVTRALQSALRRIPLIGGSAGDGLGYSHGEIANLGPLDITIENDRPLVADNIRKRLSGEVDQVGYVLHGLRKNGDVIDIELHSSTMRIGGKLLLVSLLMDITERTRSERAVQALQDELREQSLRDALTGLYNRRYLEETLARELTAAGRAGHPVSLILADLDHFKAVNDTFGHLAGDEVLRVFGALIRRHARGSDICCRYGGEEFLLVFPGMAQENAVARAECLRAALAGSPVVFGTSLIPVSASFGVAAFPRDGLGGDELIAAADGAMYAAKAAGRNCVHVRTCKEST